MNYFTRLVASAAVAAGLVATTAQADTPYFAGKTVEIIVPTSGTGSYGIYARLLSEALPRHIAGNPAVIVTPMSGAGGVRASNYVAQKAAKDGTVIYAMHQNAPTQQLLQPEIVGYDASKFIPVGVATALNSAMALRKDAPARTLEEAKTNEVVIGTTGRGSYQYVVPTLLNQLKGTKFKVITTYPGTGELMLATDQGEIQGMSSSLLTFQDKRPDWVSGAGDAEIIFQIGADRDPNIPNVPLLSELATSDAERKIYRFMSLSNKIARSFVLPPGVPDDRAAELRKAFQDALKDEALLAQVAKMGAPLVSADAEALGQTIADILSTEKDVYMTAQKIMTE